MTIRRQLCILLALLLSAGPPALAAKYAGEAFSLGVGARGLAMGGAVVAGPFDGAAAYWNPAGMNYLDGRNLIAMHAETFGSLLNHDYVSYIDARPRGEHAIQSFGFYMYYLGGGGIKITRLNEFDRPEVEREESHGDFLFAAALSGRLWDKIDFGATAKVIYRDIGTESGYGLTLDAGALYQVYPFARLGLMVTDITTGFIRYSGETFDTGANTETIYPAVKPGLMLEHTVSDFTGRFAMSGDIRFEGIRYGAQYWSGDISLDTHYGWEIGYREMVFGRAGFDIGRFTAGGGVDLRNITVDFAYLHDDELDETFRVSAGYCF
ncbi:hypothetical protein GF420_03125 [candidate division GN15 bacterium]|nr:hypothetical protein [candidate division GN15 bacterium]